MVGRLRARLRGAGERGDEGQVLLLSLGFAVLAILLVLVVTAASAVHLDRKRLLATADLAALAAADQLDTEYFRDPAAAGGRGIPLSDASVRAAVERYVAEHPEPNARWDRIRVLEASTPDGQTAVVRLGALTMPPLVTWVLDPWTDGIALEVEATARAS